MRNLIYNLAWQASVYHIWLERNLRVHSQAFLSSISVGNRIIKDIRLKILSLSPAAIQTIDPPVASSLGLTFTVAAGTL